MLIKIAEEFSKKEPEPSEEDLKRYFHYIDSISDDEVADWPEEMTINIRRLLPKRSMERRAMRLLVERLEERNKELFKWALKKSVVDYILMDPAERVRIRIYHVPKEHPHNIIRGPLPWHGSFVAANDTVRNTLFFAHPVIVRIRKLWDDKYAMSLCLMLMFVTF